MAKGFGGLWLKSLRRMTRTPRVQGQKLVKSLLKKSVSTAVNTALKGVLGTTPASPARKYSSTARRPSSVTKSPAASPSGRGKITRPVRLPRGSVPAGASWQKAYFTLPETAPSSIPRRMQYWLYLPSGFREHAPLPMVVMLHGCKQTACDIATATKMNALAERKGFAVLYPHQSSGADTHRCWHWYQRATQRGQGDVAMIAKMIAFVQQRHQLDASRTYAAGLSAGAALAHILALRHPGLIAAVGLHSAPVFGTSDSTLSAYRAMQHGSPLAYQSAARDFLAEHENFPGMPVMLIHGERDTVVRRVNAVHLQHQFAIINARYLARPDPVRRLFAGRPTGRNQRPPHHTDTWYVKRRPYMVYCEVSGLGHAWSGGDDSVDFSDRAGPNVSLMLWDFFAYHRRNPISGAGSASGVH